MAIKKSLYIIFGILTLLISLEVGFYLGVNFTKNQKEIINHKETAQAKSSIPAFTERINIKEENEIKTESSASAYHPDVFKPERLKTAQSIPAWYVKESQLFTHFVGRVKNIDWGKGIIVVENINNSSETYEDRFTVDRLNDVPFIAKLESTDKEIPITKDDILPGDILSVYDKLDFTTGKLSYLQFVVERKKK